MILDLYSLHFSVSPAFIAALAAFATHYVARRKAPVARRNNARRTA